jgi:hypothetical protein
MISIRPVIDASSDVSRRLPEKAIFWPTVADYESQGRSDSVTFPDLKTIKTRYGASTVLPLTAFAEAVSAAQDRVLILDGYLFEPETGRQQERIEGVLQWFHGVSLPKDVRLLTSAINPDAEAMITKQVEEHSSLINDIRAYPGGLKIKLRFTLSRTFPYVHDRFAVIDSELWHFGATVGGFHHKVNAASRGWSASDHRAVEFFDRAWAGDRDCEPTHDKRGSK